MSWSEIWKFQTSSTPPLAAVPRTIYVEQGDIRAIPMIFQGGDAGSKTATVTSLPAEGTLYQYIGGVPGAEITIVPTDVTDASFNLIYSANGASGNGVGNFDFHFTDVTGTSADATYTINVSPLGIPNFIYASKEIDRVEITFDRNMADPTGKHLEFAVQDNGVDVTSTSCSLKAGDPTTIVVYVTPNLDTDHAIGVAYSKGTVTAESNGALESFDFQLADKLAQVINFSALSDRTYGDAAFTLSTTATSGLPVTFSSSNPAAVSVSGTTATVHNAGETLISASQAGDATYSAVTFVRHQLVNKAVASVTISDLSQEYTGSALEATVTTNPADLTIKVTYDGLPALPVDIGTYTVLAEVEEVNYDGSATDLFVITDLTPPVPDLATLPDWTGECSATPVAPTATDLSAGTITGTTTSTFPVTAQGITVVTWTYEDGNGNTVTQDQNVLVADVLAPTATAPEDMITCDGTVSDIALKYVIDNCSTPFVTYTLTGATTGNGLGDATSELFNPDVTKVTYTLNDDYGNSSQYSFTVAYQVVEDVIITATDGTLTCENTGSYQWINCADNSIVEGETSASFSPATSGEYAVILTRDECSNTSDCYSFTASGIGNREVNQEYKVYPNPAHDYVTIDMSDEQTNATIKVVDMTGKILRMEELDRFIKTDLDISSFKTGLYLIQIHSDQINSVARLLKQ